MQSAPVVEQLVCELDFACAEQASGSEKDQGRDHGGEVGCEIGCDAAADGVSD